MTKQAKRDSSKAGAARNDKEDDKDKGALPKVRDAGPHAMKDKPVRKWEKVDEESDESFPASDPPGNY